MRTTGLCSLRTFLQQVLFFRQNSAGSQKFGLPDSYLRKTASKVRNTLRLWTRPEWSSHFELVESTLITDNNLAERLVESNIFNLNRNRPETFIALEHKIEDGTWARDGEWACSICTF